MKRIVTVLTVIALGLGSGVVGYHFVYRYAYAQGISGAPYDAAPPAAAPVVTSDIAVAQAPTTAPAPDAETHVIVAPADDGTAHIEQPRSTWDQVITLWRRGAFAPAVILAAFGLLLLARRWVPKLQQPPYAAYSAIAVTALTTLTEPAMRGTTPTLEMVIAAVTGAVLFTMRPHAIAAATSGELPAARVVKP